MADDRAAAAGPSAEFYLPNYRMGKTLGIGSFGKVKLAEHALTGHKVAIKILNRKKIKAMDMDEKGAQRAPGHFLFPRTSIGESKAERLWTEIENYAPAPGSAFPEQRLMRVRNAVRREIKILRLFMHPHIIRLYEVVETPTDIFVVMEYVKAGELFDHIVEKGRLGESEARHFFQQIVSGVEYCHRNMVVHRDLKPENLLLDGRKNVKIADFGLSNVMRDGHFLRTSCGSPNYAAPEVISGRLYAGPEVDVWSCGVILYALLCGSLPFDDESIPNLFKKIKGGIYTLPSHLSPSARDLIARMLLVDPLKRITIPEIRLHPWFVLHLPRYLAVSPPDTAAQATKIDAESLEQVVKMGFDRTAVVDALRRQIRNKATVAYYLILDNRRQVASGYLGADFEEGMPVQPEGGIPQAGPMGARRPSAAAAAMMQQRIVAHQTWTLGLQTRLHPSETIVELLRVLALYGICWKKGGPYNVRARMELPPPSGASAPPPPSPESAGDPRVIKFELQLYRVKEERYILDIQRLEGDLMSFVDVCGRLLSELRLPM